MSCVTDVKLEVRDLDSLRAACTELGVTLTDNKTYAAHEGRAACVAEIVVPGSQYSVGVIEYAASREAGPTYSLKYDVWGPQGRTITNALGNSLDKLRQEYAVAVATKKAQAMAQRGWTVARENLPNGNVRLALKRR